MSNRYSLAWLALAMSVIWPHVAAASEAVARDVVVYGGTPGGVMAAIAAGEGASVALLEQTRHVGGMSTSGLNRDEGEHMHREETFGGLCDQFIKTASSESGFRHSGRGAYVWQSNIAERVMLRMLEDAKVEIRYEQRIDSVARDGNRIKSLTVVGGQPYRGKIFIDATYEGDLLAKAGVSFVTGRESRDEFDEPLAGVIYPDKPVEVSAYDEEGKLLFGVMPGAPPQAGSASEHPTPYNIRLNLTAREENRVPITKPDNFDPRQHELLARCIEAGLIKGLGQIFGFYGMPGGKVECNNRQFSIVSMSIPGTNALVRSNVRATRSDP